MIKNLLSALQFLTILPAGEEGKTPGAGTVPYFPLVGLAIGMMLAALDSVLQHLFSLHIVSLIDVIFLAVITGALHLDGLADTADGLFSHRGREEALRIMKDSRIGTMGLLAIVFVLGIKWAGISSAGPFRSLCLILPPAYARGAFSIAIHVLDYARPEGGTASPFFAGTKSAKGLAWLLAPVLLSFLLGFRGILLNLVFIAVAASVLVYYKKKIGGVTGDMLGALGEVMEAALFLFAGVAGY